MNAVTAIEETNPIAPTVTGEANPILPRTKTVITTEIDITTTLALGIVGVHEDTTADLGTDRAIEDMTMDLLGTDRDTVGIVGTMTVEIVATMMVRGDETTELRIGGEMIGMEIVTGEKDLAVRGIMAIETGVEMNYNPPLLS